MLPLVTLCGSHNFSKDWVEPCINSWRHIRNADAENWYLIPDNNLEPKDATDLMKLGFQIKNEEEDCQQIESVLKTYPALSEIRNKDLTWRKLLDTAILFRQFEKIVLIDTDVYVTASCLLPEIDSDLIYMLEDIPAYRGNWTVAWQQDMVPAFNAGLVIFKPSIVDFDFLEFLTKKYVLNCKDYWWSEQLAWACLAGRTKKRYVFSGEQTRVVSGFIKRTPTQVINNQYVYFGKRGLINKFSAFKPYIEGSKIIHFAGMGKHWFKESREYLAINGPQDDTGHIIDVYRDRTLSLKDKLCISSRLFIKEMK